MSDPRLLHNHANLVEARELAQNLLRFKVGGDRTREQALWESFLTENDTRVRFEAFKLLYSYAYGKPKETQDINVSEQSYVAKLPDKHDPEEWAKRYAPQPKKSKDNA